MAQPVEHLVELCHQALGTDVPILSLRMLRPNLAKTLFEFEHRGQQYVAKCSPSQRKRATLDLMQRVWDAGMRPPSAFRIVRPVASFSDCGLLLQEKAIGENVLNLIASGSSHAMEAVERAAAWLHAMHELKVDLPAGPDLRPVVERCRRELENSEASMLLDEIHDQLDVTHVVPSHGDFHPQNVFVSSDGIATAIDLDTLSCREPAFDVAWFQAQLAIMGYHNLGSFGATAEFRKRFQQCSPRVDDHRVQLHVRLAVIRSLHYDLCILKLGKRDHVQPLLHAAKYGLDA